MRPFKKFLPTRLGFKAEYIYHTVTVAGSSRKPIYFPLPNEVSTLPLSLYPNNKNRLDKKFSLLKEDQNLSEAEKASITKWPK